MRLSGGVVSPVLPEQSLPEQSLRDAGLRVTQQRVAVLDAVRRLPHADTDSLISAVRAAAGDISHQAVYDVLKVLTEARLVRKIQPLGTVARYESRVGDNHHHVVCRGCGAIADVDCAVGDTPCLTASDTAGFLIDEAEVIYWGRCSRCVTAVPS
jgi:Fur family ferric uptake transcriptional regulator